jgi:hypothetical protein
MSEGQIRVPTPNALNEIMRNYEEKIKNELLPPDPANLADVLLRIPVELEHMIPIPPVLGYLHENYVEPALEALPKLPMTSTVPPESFLRYFKVQGLPGVNG